MPLLTDNGTQFVSGFFKTTCPFLETNRLATTMYHSQKDGEAKLINKVIVSRPRTYVIER